MFSCRCHPACNSQRGKPRVSMKSTHRQTDGEEITLCFHNFREGIAIFVSRYSPTLIFINHHETFAESRNESIYCTR